MYTHPTTAEQCLHNALKIVHAMRYAGMDYDVQVRECVLHISPSVCLSPLFLFFSVCSFPFFIKFLFFSLSICL